MRLATSRPSTVPVGAYPLPVGCATSRSFPRPTRSVVRNKPRGFNRCGKLTLIHADINPSDVLVQDGKPYFIDWQTARWGPLYLDLPHHHCTLAQAELYRRALAARGYAIPPDAFAAHYR